MKACLIIGPAYVLGYREIYPLLRDKILQLGIWTVGWESEKGHLVGNWFTTLKVERPDDKKLVLTKKYNNDYRVYDNYDAIECTSKDIPTDYEGKIGVPITFFKYYNYLPYNVLDLRADLKLNNKQLFTRLIIQKRK